MKLVLSIVGAAAVGVAAGYFLLGRGDSDLAGLKAREAQWLRDKALMESSLAAARNRAPTVEIVEKKVEVQVLVEKSPKDTLDRLLKMRPGEGEDRYRTLRKIIHELESLVDTGKSAVPAIREFLRQNVDVSYERERDGGGPGGGGNAPQVSVNISGGGGAAVVATATTSDGTTTVATGTGGERRDGGRGPGGPGGPGGFSGFGGPPGSPSINQLPRTDNYYPYSLRMGLFNVLKDIGGGEAEGALGEVLGTTGRGVEVASLATILEQMAPGKYRDAAIQAAKDLLTTPVNVPNPTRMDEDSKGYLYAVLAKFNDVSFVPTAQAQLFTADGRIDRSALSYLTATLKDQVVPTLYNAWKDPRLTNGFEKASILVNAMNYVGTSPVANQMFMEVIDSAVVALAQNPQQQNQPGGPGRGSGGPGGGRGGFNPDAMAPFIAISRLDNGDLTADQIAGRQQLLLSVKQKITDERLTGMIDRTLQGLQEKLNPQSTTSGDRDGDRRRRGPGF